MALKKEGNRDLSNPYLVAAWLRKGEIDAMKKRHEVEEYSRHGLMDSLPSIRKMVVDSFNSSSGELDNILKENGVILIITKSLDGTDIKGVTRWIGGNPIVQITGEGNTNEEKWFTFFHELGHVVLHGRKDQFMEYYDDYKDETDIEKESAADDFAKQQMFLSCMTD